jgi:hypothetical protein
MLIFTLNNRSKNHQFVDFMVGKKKNYRKIILSGKNHRLKKSDDFIALTPTYAGRSHAGWATVGTETAAGRAKPSSS